MNLIRVFDFYVMFLFVLGLWRRVGQYREVARLVVRGPARWPRLLKLVKEHHTLFITWPTIAPALLTLALSLTQLAASHLVVPQPRLTTDQVAEHWIALLVLIPIGLAMVLNDIHGVAVVSEIPREEMEKYFDQAEYWLRSRTAHVVRWLTLGYVNPRQMVAVEVRNALIEASRLLNSSLWWMARQLGLRIAFGLALWGTWAVIGRGE